MIALVTTNEERAAVYSFRYSVIVREQGHIDDPAVDHDKGMIIDPADEFGVLFAAWDNGTLVGTVRCNLLKDGPALPYSRVLGLESLTDEARQLTSVTSRLVVAARWRGAHLGIRLAQMCYRYYHAAGLAWDYIIVHHDLVQFYYRLGYTPAGEVVEFSGVGLLTPLKLNLNPYYLQQVRSILIAGSSV